MADKAMENGEYLKLLTRKRELLETVYHATKETVFVGDDNDLERYSKLFDERDTLFKEVYQIDEKLQTAEAEEGEKVEVAKARIKKVVAAIIELDKKSEPYAKKAMAAVKAELKGVNQTKNLSAGYSQNATMNAGYYFDTTN